MSQPPYPPRGPYPGPQGQRPQFPPGYGAPGPQFGGPPQGYPQQPYPAQPRPQQPYPPRQFAQPRQPPRQFAQRPVAPTPPKKRKTWLILLAIPLLLVVGVVGYFGFLEVSHNQKTKQADALMLDLGNDYMTAYVNGDFDTLMRLTQTPTIYDTALLTPAALQAAVANVDITFTVTDGVGFSSFGTSVIDLTMDGETKSIEVGFDKVGDQWLARAEFLPTITNTAGLQFNGEPRPAEGGSHIFPGQLVVTPPTSPHLIVLDESALTQTVWPGDEASPVEMVPQQAIVNDIETRLRTMFAECEAGQPTKCAWNLKDHNIDPGAIYEFGGEAIFNGFTDLANWTAEYDPAENRWRSWRWFTEYPVYVTGRAVPFTINDKGEITHYPERAIELNRTPIPENTSVMIDVIDDQLDVSIV